MSANGLAEEPFGFGLPFKAEVTRDALACPKTRLPASRTLSVSLKRLGATEILDQLLARQDQHLEMHERILKETPS